MSKFSRLACIPAVCLGLMLGACSTVPHDSASTHQAPSYHIGAIEPTELFARFDIFKQNKSAEAPEVSDQQLATLAQHLDNKKIVVVFGTWCEDSQREVPRLLNIIERINHNHPNVNIQTEFLAVAPSSLRDKGIVKKYSIRAVPTIMLFDHDQEAGRVVEHTPTSLAVALSNMKL